MSELPTPVRIGEILNLLPHRYPFLMVDRVTAFTPGERLEAYKNVTFNEPFFQGHFPGLPVMPGVLICEALAQTGGLLTLMSDPALCDGTRVFLFAGIDNVRFRAPVVPGDRLDLQVYDVRRKLSVVKMSGQALVDGKVVASGTMTAAIANRKDV
jgi:3-hydroxyacyl-[acyl-carrier-protein] dehydratase